MAQRKYDFGPGDIVIGNFSGRRVKVLGISPDGFLSGLTIGFEHQPEYPKESWNRFDAYDPAQFSKEGGPDQLAMFNNSGRAIIQ